MYSNMLSFNYVNISVKKKTKEEIEYKEKS